MQGTLTMTVSVRDTHRKSHAENLAADRVALSFLQQRAEADGVIDTLNVQGGQASAVAQEILHFLGLHENTGGFLALAIDVGRDQSFAAIRTCGAGTDILAAARLERKLFHSTPPSFLSKGGADLRVCRQVMADCSVCPTETIKQRLLTPTNGSGAQAASSQPPSGVVGAAPLRRQDANQMFQTLENLRLP